MKQEAAPIVSVCVATYNQDRYIKDCLTSVLAQLPDVSLEILVGDDGAGAETPQIVRQLMDRHPGVIRYFRHPENLGPAANYQFLVARARGRYIAHLDGDDFWLPGKLSVQTAWLETHPESLACYANAVVIDDQGAVAGVFSSPIGPSVDLHFLLEQGNFLNHSSMLYRASHRTLVLDISGPFIDYRLHLNFARHGILGFTNRALVVYRLGSEHSMIRTMPATVHALYFEALNSVISGLAVSQATRRAALTYFWRSIVLMALPKFNAGEVRRWSAKFRATYPSDYAYVMTLGSLKACLRIGLALSRRLKGLFWKSHEFKVLYER